MRARTALRLAPALAVTAAALAAAPSGQAASIELTGTVGPSASEILIYRASRGERNRVTVTFNRGTTVIADPGAKRIAADRYTGCRPSGRRRVVCRASDATISLELHDGDDSARFSPGGNGHERRITNLEELAAEFSDDDDEGAIDESTWIDGGPGDDRLSGSAYEDLVIPGAGADVVHARGGDDLVFLAPDGAKDAIRASGGVDSLHFNGAVTRVRGPVMVDLAAGTAGGPGESDSISGFQRVHGGIAADTLLGSKYADALYGEGGNDLVDGRGGTDLITGDSPAATEGFANRLFGGTGADLIDARSARPSPTSPVDCGPGADIVDGDVDDLLDDSCETAALTDGPFMLDFEQPDFDLPMRAASLGRGPNGEYVFEFPCPARTGGCSGRIAVESAPPPGSPPTVHGATEFSASAGERVPVAVALDEAGRAAAAGGSPVAVHVTGVIASTNPSSSFRQELDSGWQLVLPR